MSYSQKEGKMARQPKPSKVEILWVDRADLFLTKSEPQKKIASITMSKIGYIIAWHEAIPTKISQRLSSIWYSREAAEFVIMAAYSETLEDHAKKEAKQ